MSALRWLGIGMLALLPGMGACSSTTPITPPPVDTTEPPDTAYIAGESYYGANDYVEYIAGDLPIILSAPHGGDLEPLGIADRTATFCGGSAVTLADRNTRELTLAIRDSLEAHFGGSAHVVINHLHRKKLDANRSITEAACGNGAAERAWREYQAFLDRARDAVTLGHRRGWFMDMHGHGHDIQRLELGYLLEASDLAVDDQAMSDSEAMIAESSLQTLALGADATFAEILRGETSLGALYEQRGFPAIPGPTDPAPGDDPYFTGGYNLHRHACAETASGLGGRAGGSICGVQIEGNFTGVRDTGANRAAFAGATVEVLATFLPLHWSLEIATASP